MINHQRSKKTVTTKGVGITTGTRIKFQAPPSIDNATLPPVKAMPTGLNAFRNNKNKTAL